MNPFEGKSLKELIDGVPGYKDAKLDGLVAVYIDKYEEVKPFRHEEPDEVTLAYVSYYFRNPGGEKWVAVPSPTSDGREAMRLLVKYHLQIGEASGDEWWVGHDLSLITESLEEPLAHYNNPCRAITEAALSVALAEMIKKAGHAV